MCRDKTRLLGTINTVAANFLIMGGIEMSIASIGNPAAIIIAKPILSAKDIRSALRIGGALILMAATAWIAYEAVTWQGEQQMIHEVRLGNQP